VRHRTERDESIILRIPEIVITSFKAHQKALKEHKAHKAYYFYCILLYFL